MTAAREHYKHACLEILGLPLLVARHPLPGAAASRPRLPARPSGVAGIGPPREEERPGPAAATAPPAVEIPSAAREAPTSAAATPARPAPAEPGAAAEPARFSLAVIRAGDLLWLETLLDGGLGAAQQQLLAAMAAAVCGGQPGIRETLFDWPLHNNPQLDHSARAAAAALEGFLRRLLQEQACRALCLLGEDAPLDLVPDSLGAPLLRLPSTREMLDQPLRKRDAWRVLAPLCQRPA